MFPRPPFSGRELCREPGGGFCELPEHRRPTIAFSEAPRGTCRWCGDPILHAEGPKRGQLDRRRRWHPACVDIYNLSDPREARRLVRRRDRGICAACGLDTYALRRKLAGRGRTAALRRRGFKPRKSLWELDHIVPLIDGGGHDPSNLQTLCTPCHKEKSALEARTRAARRLADPEGQPSRNDPDGALDTALADAADVNAKTEAALAQLAELARPRDSADEQVGR